MKILVFIPVWKRREITRLCYESLKRTLLSAPKGFSFVVVIAASNEQDAVLAHEYGFDVTLCDNTPLGAKFNTGLEYALDTYNFDYLMQINSDNVLSTDFWQVFTQYFDAKQYFFGVDRVYFYDSTSKQIREFLYAGGCGIRFIRRDIVELSGYVDDQVELWTPGISSGLDNDSSNAILRRSGKMQYMARHKTITRPVVVDVKSEINIHPFSEFRLARQLTAPHRAQLMKRFPELKVFDERMVKQKI